MVRRSFVASCLSLFGLVTLLGMASAQECQNTRFVTTKDHMSGPFVGAKANKGTVMHSKVDGKNVITLSDDFVVPQTPAPHWQVIDSKGNVYLLQRLVIKGEKYNKQIMLPAYIPDVAKVQIWCAWAETLLGEASFATPMK